MQFGGWCYVSPPEIDERVAPTVDEAVEQGKPEWCPLADLGKHGRLIDADKCEDYFWEHLDDNGMAGAMNAINDMPTIVEAEDGT